MTAQPVDGVATLSVDNAESLDQEGRAALRDTLGAFFSSRVLIWVVGVAAALIIGLYPGTTILLDPHHLTAPFHQHFLNVLVSPAARWDSAWYLGIAKTGYVLPYQSVFFPLYPALIALGGAGVGAGLDLIVGIFVSVVCSIGALYLLHRLVSLDFDAPLARNTVWIVAWLPTAMVLSAVYSESLFLLLAVGTFYAGRRSRWALAGLLGGLAAASRNGGILLLVPLLIFYLYGPREDREPDFPAAVVPPAPEPGVLGLGDRLRLWAWTNLPPRYLLRRDVAWFGLVPLGLIAYMTYLAFTTGSPLGPFTHQQHWGRYFLPLGAIPLGIWSVLKAAYGAIPGLDPHLANHLSATGVTHHIFALGFLILSLFLLWICWKRLPVAYTAYTAVSLAMALSVPAHNEPLKSFPRFTLVMFPLWIALALWATEHRRVRTVIAISAPFLALTTILFVTWTWTP
ncbi:MAG: mannosyltransferase family protein [Solirubrobacterales bacterium]